MSAPWVESMSTPRTARKRCTGTATETMTSPRSLMRTHARILATQGLGDFGIAFAVVGTELVVERQIAPARATGAPR